MQCWRSCGLSRCHDIPYDDEEEEGVQEADDDEEEGEQLEEQEADVAEAVDHHNTVEISQ